MIRHDLLSTRETGLLSCTWSEPPLYVLNLERDHARRFGGSAQWQSYGRAPVEGVCTMVKGELSLPSYALAQHVLLRSI